MTELNRLTIMFLDYAEDRAGRRQQTLMTDWVRQTDRFLEFNERALLAGAGGVTAEKAERVAAERYADFDPRRDAVESREAQTAESADLAELVAIERQHMGQTEHGQPS